MDKFWQQIFKSHQVCPVCPSPAEVAIFFSDLLGTLFSDYRKSVFESEVDFEKHVHALKGELMKILDFNSKTTSQSSALAEKFFSTLPEIYEKLNEDVDAMFEGDPAAKSKQEVIRTYPGFYAIAAYRVAHQLLLLGVEGIPRIITEHAHSKTGIDIHPGARIGRFFCIDHGTGIVIGETTVIGDHVKLYQGVTLGALSVTKADAERKRHPTIENNVVIYAGATILGGETVVGHDSVVGGNVWLTRSLPAHSKVYYQSRMYNSNNDDTDMVIFKNELD